MLKYATALFDEATIERQVGYLMAMLKGMVAEPSRRCMGSTFWRPRNGELLLETWNATEAEYPEDKCIHELFEEQVARTSGSDRAGV